MATSLTKEQFLEKAKAVHGDRFSYEKSLYRNMRKPIKIVCPLHGEFEQSPMNHLKTDGCPKCGYLKRSIKQEPEIPVSTKCATCNGEGKVRHISQSMFGQMVNISACPDCNVTPVDFDIQTIDASMKEAEENLKARDQALRDRIEANFNDRQEYEQDPYVTETLENIDKIQSMSQKQNGFIGIKRNVNPSDAVNITNIINANADVHINYQPA